MPGLEQLRQFSEDVEKLGNELAIREERGEPISRVPFPENISEEDDSDDFVLGMPIPSDSEETDSSDEGEIPEKDVSAEAEGSVDFSDFPELDSILNPEPAGTTDFSDFPELAELLNPEPEVTAAPPTDSFEDSISDVAPPSETDLGLDGLGDLGSLDLPDFDNLGAAAEPVDFSLDSVDSSPDSLDLPSDFLEGGSDSFVPDTSGLDEFGGTYEASPLEAEAPAGAEVTAAPSTDSFEDSISDVAPPSETGLGLDGLDDLGDFDLPDFDNLGAAVEPVDFSLDSVDSSPDSLDLPSDFLEGGSDSFVPDTSGLDEFGGTYEASPLEAEAPAGAGTGLDDLGDFDLPDFDNLDAAAEPVDFSLDSVDSSQDSLDLPSDSLEGGSDSFVPDTNGLDSLDFNTDDFADSLSEIGAPDKGLSGEEAADEAEDRSAIDFGSHEPVKVDPSLATETVSEDDFPTAASLDNEIVESVEDFVPEHHEIFDAPDDPFDGVEPPPDENFDDFDIPGFSDQAAGMVMAKTKRPSVGGKDGKKEKNTLSDKEYEAFLKNLRDYPLNLRIELEKFIVGDEFKDEVVFEVIQKVIKKTSARQLATHLEKLLDVSIPVPREFERRTATQYEEYKKSAEYQLKNRILPIAIISVMAACIIYFIFLFGMNFIYEPLRANSLYKEGYALLEEGAYPQSEMKFDEALTYQQQKRWFFTYAEGYRQHKQYERARMMYRAGLQRFKQDKKLGLDYAEMELYDLRNFENAENVVRREVLDYHINDPDGMLLLGDIFLEWGDERDPSKYEEAKSVYDDLLQIHGQEDLYLARLMRYYIRVDDLRNVLQMKEYFYPKKKALNGQDLIELSGYLLEKISGNIAPADEYLLSSIEDVRELLERAVEAVPHEPESLYNMGLYFVNSNNVSQAQDWLSAALAAFEDAGYKPRKRLLRQLNTYRLLGDLDMENKEYLSAEEKYRTGVSLFEKEAKAGLSGDKNVGQLYASLADINYMIIGDYDEALRDYTIAANTQYDTPSVYYKMGYINYSQKKYGEALNLFIKTADELPYDTHVLYAMGNVLSIRGDNFASQGYYQRLMNILEQQRVKYEILFPQVNEEHEEIVEMYKLGANNLGVTLYRLSRQTGNSTMNAEALTNFTASLRAYDALERDQETLVRKEGSNLAEQNIKYMTMSLPTFEPAIYTEIPALLEGEYLPQ